MADRRNKTALPALATKYGFRLPPPEDCLIAPNFQFHPQKPAADMDWEESNLSTGATTQPCLMHCMCFLSTGSSCQFMASYLPGILSGSKCYAWTVYDQVYTKGSTSAGTGTEPVSAPPSRSYRAFNDAQARHPAFDEAPDANSGPSVADTGQPADGDITDMQSWGTMESY